MRFFKPVGCIRAMTFDLDDTLYDNAPVIRQAERTLAAHLDKHYPAAAKLTPPQWLAIKRDLITELPELSSDMGQLRLRTLKKALEHEALNEDELHEAAVQCFDCFYHARSDFALESTFIGTLEKLSERVPLIAITNGNVDPERIGIAPYFSAVLHASLKRPMKPHVHMFDEAVNMLDIPAQAVLHIGDSLINDVHGGACANMPTAWFAANRPMDLRQERTRTLPHVVLARFDELLEFYHR